MVGAACLFVMDVGKMYLQKVMLNAVSIQERTVMSFSCLFLSPFDVTFSQLIGIECCSNSSFSVTVNYFVCKLLLF
jgi:hypothetical protein